MKQKFVAQCSLPYLGMAKSSQRYHQEETLLFPPERGHLFPEIQTQRMKEELNNIL